MFSFDPYFVKFDSSFDIDECHMAFMKNLKKYGLWLVEVEWVSEDFRRFRGVDTKSWERVIMAMGNDYMWFTKPEELERVRDIVSRFGKKYVISENGGVVAEGS